MSESITLTSNSGTSLLLTANANIDVLMGINGRYMMPVDFVEDEIPGVPGTVIREVKIRPRPVSIPVRIKGTDPSDLRVQIRKLTSVLDPSKGDARLSIVAPDGSQRYLNCRYTGGMEGDESSMLSRYQNGIVQLKATDPFWYDSNPSVHTYSLRGSATTWFPFFPLNLAGSTIFASDVVTNTGDFYTWPQWLIQGPANGIILTNLTTGESLNLTNGTGLTLAAYETAQIILTDTGATITKNDGTNLFSYLTADSTLWALQTGPNQVQMTVNGADSNSSFVGLTWRDRYFTA